MRLWGALLAGLVACGNRTELDGSAPSMGPCSDKKATRLSRHVVWAGGLLVDGPDLYFMTYPPGSLERLPKTGGDTTILAGDVTSFVLDADRLYYGAIVGTDGAFTCSVSSLSKTGGVPSVLASGSFTVEDLVADESTLYFVGEPDGPIFALPKTGGTPAPVTDASSEGVRLVGVDDTALYWLSYSAPTTSTLWSTPKTGGPSTLLVQREDGIVPTGALDAQNVYFATGSHELVKLSKATHATITLASGLGAGGNYIVVSSGRVFFDQDDQRILSVPIDGGSVDDTCASGSTYIVSIAVDDTTIYWGSVLTSAGPIMSLPL